MNLYHNIENDLVIDIEQFHHQKQVIQKMKQRCGTFGYQEIYTSAFEPYDLYVHMNGTVNKQEMIKTIDNNGNVLVLRPDITIPLTQQIATHNKTLEEDLRYFYVQDVFRQARGVRENREQTQAGVEYFGNPSPAADAEIIALSIQLLKDIGLEDVKIEIGHAGFFGQIIREMQLESMDLQELKRLIQAKNVPDIEGFLQRLEMDDAIKEIVAALPFLYGRPKQVIQKAKELPLHEKMVQTLDNLTETYEQLQAYKVHEQIVVDLSLINHMDYYSDMIFQGFIKQMGKPVLMGGRYDTLADQFDADIPAIGFACDLDALTTYAKKETAMPRPDICFLYEKENFPAVIEMTTELRASGFQVVTYPAESDKSKRPQTNWQLEMGTKGWRLTSETETIHFHDKMTLVDFLMKEKN